MLNSKKISIYKKAISSFGKADQIIVAIEECSELQKELTKALRGKVNLLGIAEEIADVEIMLEQLKLIFDNRQEVEKFKNAKIVRLNKTLRSMNKSQE